MLTFFKIKLFRSNKYTDWVKSQPSCVSGMPADDPHHIKCKGFGGSKKCSDLWTIPLTRQEHTEFHNIGAEKFEMKYNICQKTEAMKMVDKAFSEGLLIMKGAK